MDSLTAYDLVRVTGLSSGYCKQVKKRDKRLHPMHWEELIAASC